jgi:hypothetical protein
MKDAMTILIFGSTTSKHVYVAATPCWQCMSSSWAILPLFGIIQPSTDSMVGKIVGFKQQAGRRAPQLSTYDKWMMSMRTNRSAVSQSMHVRGLLNSGA